jgi:hypothetical protein
MAHIDSELVHALRKFAMTEGDLGIDFEVGEADEGKDMVESLAGSAAKRLAYVGHHGSGSPICISKRAEDGGAVVWLDSEGQKLVLARTPRELLALLPYDTGYIFDIASHWNERLSENGEGDEDDRSEFAADAARERLHEAVESNEAVASLCRWLEKHGIAPASDPFETVGEAARANASLRSWLSASEE